MAQDSSEAKPKPTITAAVDVYYRYNFSNPSKASKVYNNFTSFTNSHNSFELGMATVKAEHTIGKVGMVADLGFGKRAEEFSYNDENTRFIIKQLNVSYTPWNNVKFTAGSWATHVGYEVVDAYANRNYSMSYMFSKGPFFHTGLKTDITAGKSGFMLGVANPTDLKSASFSSKFLIGQYSFSLNDNVKAYLNYQGGKPNGDARIRQYDLVITNALSDHFSLGYNGTIANSWAKKNGKFSDKKTWWGSALYLTTDPVTWFGLTLRTEYFKDENSITDVFSSATSGGSVFASTLSANFRISNLTIIPELRWDKASREIFLNHSGETKKGTATALVAAVYKL
ncbi:MAG: porin [Flavisolibacter sp.]|nr:porin [Flavisolibacter sp.]